MGPGSLVSCLTFWVPGLKSLRSRVPLFGYALVPIPEEDPLLQTFLKESLETEQVAFKLNTRSIARLNPQTLLQCLTSESERRALVENMFGHGVNSMVWLRMRSGQRKSNYPVFFNKKRLDIIFGLPSCEFCRISKST